MLIRNMKDISVIQEKDTKRKNNAKNKAKSVIIAINNNSGLFTWQDLKKDNIKVMELNFQNSDYYGQVQEMEDGTVIRNGKGVLKYHSGRIFEGTWVNDMRDGEGYEKFSSSANSKLKEPVAWNVYKGSFLKGRAHGKGVYTWHTGEVYEGEWVKGHKHGRGVWKGQFNEYFIGDWKRSKPHGYGMHIWTNGDRYEGEWKQALKCGNGTDIFANGDVYVGEYKDGKF